MNPFAQRKEVTMNDETATTATAERVWKKYYAGAFTFGKDERGKALHCITEIERKTYHFYLPLKLVESHLGFESGLSNDCIYIIDSVTMPDNFEVRLWNKDDGERTVNPAELVKLDVLVPYTEEAYANEEKAKERARAKRSSRREHTPETLEPVASVEIPEELRR